MRNNEIQPALKIPLWPVLSSRQWAVFLLLLGLALTLRCINLDKYPRKYQTLDEYHYLWAGMSLIHDGRPTAWSILENYYKMPKTKPRMISHGDLRAPMVTPALDHPPLFSLTAGAFGMLVGGHPVMRPQAKGPPFQIWRVNLLRARILPLLLFIVTFFLLFQISRAEYSFAVACLALLFYAVITHIAFHNRLIVTENMTTPLFLLNILYLQRYIAGKSSRTAFAAVSIISIAAALLCKLIAVSQAAAIIYLLFLYGRRRDILFPILGVLAGVAIYLAYGWWQDWEVFTAILGNQAGRFRGFGVTQRFLTMPAMVHTNNMHYLLLVGWLSLFMLLAVRKQCAILTAAAVYLLAFAFFASVPTIYGWHIIPFYPFLCIALAAAIHNTYRAGKPVESITLMVLLISALLQSLRPLIQNDLLLWWFWLAMIIFIAAALALGKYLRWRHLRRRILRLGLVGIVAAAVCMEIWGVWTHEIWRKKPNHMERAAIKRHQADTMEESEIPQQPIFPFQGE